MRDFQLPGRSPVFAANGLCATSHPLAAETAIGILKDGGNAADAAIGSAVLLGICEPQMTGIGGDCFVLLKPAGEERIVALNGSGRAPAALSAGDMRGRGLAEVPKGGPEAVTVPGAVDAFCRLSEDWGRMPLAEVLAPAIRYADEGVPVAPRTAFDWAHASGTLNDVARGQYLIGGAAPRPGQIFRSPGNAEALRRIAREGRKGFYEGEVAEDMVAALRAAGGVHTLEDFAATACDYADPISGTYKGVELVEHPPNGQGATAILMANILSHFDLPDMDPLGSCRAHVEAEAAKLAHNARNRFLADPDHTVRLDHILSVETATQLASLIRIDRAMGSPRAISEAVHKETVYLTVVDSDRMAVSLIYSIFDSFRSGLSTEKFGVLFHNRGNGFSLEEGHPNEAGLGKRPMHTIIPAMIREGERVTVPFGVMGAAYQPNGHVRFVTNMLDFGMDPQTAIHAPRCFSDATGMRVERGYSDAVRVELAVLGHRVVIADAPIGGAQAIRIHHEDGVLEGASDPRKDGCALGY